jgi:hypothetical protein
MTTYPKREIEVVPEANDEQDNPTLWSMFCGYSWNGNGKRNHYIWIAKYDGKDFRVENSNGYNLADKVFKTLWGAKREAEGIAWRQNESGCFTD